jgi:hypothetical protein
MSPKREKVLSVDEAIRRFAEAERALKDAVSREHLQKSYDVRVAATEPKSSGRVVRFSHSYNGRNFTYAAIRADNWRGARRWFLTSADEIAGSGHRGIDSPATWVELVAFSIPGTIYVAPLGASWKPVAVPVSNPDPAQASPEVTRAIADMWDPQNPFGDPMDPNTGPIQY